MGELPETNIDILDFIKIKNFDMTKGTINKIKRQEPNREKIFLNHITKSCKSIEMCASNVNFAGEI